MLTAERRRSTETDLSIAGSLIGMTSLTSPPPCAREYDALAEYYDRFTAGYAHARWIGEIESRARGFGLAGKRALDLGCGTGNSTRPLVDLGYEIAGLDISPEMVRVAREKHPDHAHAFLVGDMRALSGDRQFDLVLCLDDALNYLQSTAELEATFRGVARTLAPDGVFVFDVNSLATYQSAFAQAIVRERPGTFFAWRGQESGALPAGTLASATVEIFVRREDGLWERHTSRHCQRHHPASVILGALTAAGLSCADVLGQLPGAILDSEADELRHTKILYFVRQAGVGLPDGAMSQAGVRSP